jgi:hypothetical protein
MPEGAPLLKTGRASQKVGRVCRFACPFSFLCNRKWKNCLPFLRLGCCVMLTPSQRISSAGLLIERWTPCEAIIARHPCIKMISRGCGKTIPTLSAGRTAGRSRPPPSLVLRVGEIDYIGRGLAAPSQIKVLYWAQPWTTKNLALWCGCPAD